MAEYKDWGAVGFKNFLSGRNSYYRRSEFHEEMIGTAEWRAYAPANIRKGYYEKVEGGKARKYRLREDSASFPTDTFHNLTLT